MEVKSVTATRTPLLNISSYLGDDRVVIRVFCVVSHSSRSFLLLTQLVLPSSSSSYEQFTIMIKVFTGKNGIIKTDYDQRQKCLL